MIKLRDMLMNDNLLDYIFVLTLLSEGKTEIGKYRDANIYIHRNDVVQIITIDSRTETVLCHI